MWRLSILCLAIASLAVVRSADIEEEEDVLVLTEDNFEGAVKSNEFLLVEFYAPWCGHCKSLAPEYASAAGKLKAEESSIRLAKVDATIHKKLASDFSIQGFPTLKFFVNGVASDYKGGRTSDTIVAWLKKKTGPPAVALADLDAAKEFIGEKSIVVIGLFADETTAEAKGFLEAARNAPDDIPFGITASSDVAKEYGITSEYGFVAVRTFDEPQVVYDSDNYSSDAIGRFALDNSLPLVIPFSQESAARIFSGAFSKQLLYFGSATSDYFTDHVAILKELAIANKGKILFVTLDTDSEENVKILDVFGVKKDAVPLVRVVELQAREMRKFQPESDEITLEVLTQFVAGVMEGTIKPTLKSDEIPADWDAKPVKTVVGKNFYDVVVKSDRNVLIQFYAPWCGHCKKLEPVWNELGEYYDGRDDVTIAKMDATTNEIEGLNIQGFPTIKLFLAGDKATPMDYKGARELKPLKLFVESGGRDGGVDGGRIPIPEGMRTTEPEDFEAAEEEDIPLEETEEEKAIREELESSKQDVKEEL